jgi:hypothetical protein
MATTEMNEVQREVQGVLEDELVHTSDVHADEITAH